MKIKKIIIIFGFIILTSCVGYSSTGVLGTGVSIALDPRSLGTQIDDSLMQQNLRARLLSTDKLHLIVFIKNIWIIWVDSHNCKENYPINSKKYHDPHKTRYFNFSILKS